MKYPVLKAGLAVLLLGVVFAFPARAQERAPQGAHRPNVIRVSVNAYPPGVTIDGSGRPGGYDIRLLELLTERLGLRIEYHNYPFQRGLKLMESGDIDLMIGVLRRPEREKYLLFVDPPYQEMVSTAFYVRKGEEWRVRGHGDLHGLVIGTGIGVRYYPEFDNDTRIHKDPVRAGVMNFRRLLAGRVDAVIMNEEVGDHRLIAGGFEDEIGKAEYVRRERQEVHVVLSRRSPFAVRLKDFERVMGELVAEGARSRLKTEYAGEDDSGDEGGE